MGQMIRICLQRRRPGFDHWVRKIPWRKEWLPTPVFLPEFHGQRSLVGYSPWGHKDLDTTEHACTIGCIIQLNEERTDFKVQQLTIF